MTFWSSGNKNPSPYPPCASAGHRPREDEKSAARFAADYAALLRKERKAAPKLRARDDASVLEPSRRPRLMPSDSVSTRLRAALEDRRTRHILLALALLLMVPSIGSRLFLDDHVLRLLQRDDPGIAGLVHRPLDLFVFTTGDPQQNHALMGEGAMLPWWTYEELKVAFFRPIASLTHMLDFALWSDSPEAMHVHSLAWMALMLLSVGAVYRRFMAPAWLGTLAFALYALDEAHGATLSWIANRNALIAVALSLPALLFHDRWRRGHGWPALTAALLCMLAGLLSAELAIGVTAYLAAYAVCLDRGSWRARLSSLAPYAFVVLAWRVAYQTMGYGAEGSGAYHDPGRQPLAFLEALAENGPLLLSSQLGPPISDLAFWGNPAGIPWLSVIALVILAVVGWLAWPLRRDRDLQFWATGMILAVIPSAASMPGARVLLYVGVGGAAVLARLLSSLLQSSAEETSSATQAVSGSGLRRAMLMGLVAVHLIAGPFGLPLKARSMEWLAQAVDEADASIPYDPEIRDQTLIIANAPVHVYASYIQLSRESRGRPRPAQVHWLATASSTLRLKRTGPRSVEVRPQHGFLYSPPERHYRAEKHPLEVGDRVQLPRLSVEVRELTADGRPARARFDFDEPLDSPHYRWVRWQDGRYVPYQPPAPGESSTFPREDFFQLALGHMLEQLAP